MKKILFLALATQLIAADLPINRPITLNGNPQETQKESDPCTQHGMPAICCLNKTGPFVIASFLYWESQFTNSTITSKQTAVGENGIAYKLKDKSMDFDFNPGFKLGLGVNLEHDNWSPLALWTYMHSSPSKTWNSSSNDLTNDLTLPVTKNLQSIVSSTGILIGAKQVQSQWHLNFNSVDLEIGKNFPVSPNFAIRAFGCVKLGSVNQKLTVKYNNLLSYFDAVVPLVWPNQTFSLSNQAWLVGPRVGVNNYFEIIKDFGFLANVATSLLAVMYDTKVTTRVTLPSGVSGLPIGNLEKTPQTNIQPEFDLYLGFNWGHCFKNKAYLNIGAGYEFQWYASVIDAFQSLAFNGLTATALIDF